MSTSRWKIISKKGRNFENMFISICALGLAPAQKPKPKPLQLVGISWLQIHGNRYFLKTELNRHINKLHHVLKKRPELIIKGYKYYQNLLTQMESFADTIPQKDFNQLNLVDYLKKWAGFISRALPYGYNYYLLDQPTAEIILKVLKRNKVLDVFSTFETLSQAKELSVIQKEKIDLLKLVKKIKESKLSLSSPIVKKAINQHLSTYAFMGMFYFRGRPWQNTDIVKRIKYWLKSNWPAELKKAVHFKKANNLTQKILQKYKFTPYEKKLITIMKEMNYATNRYDEVHNYYTYKSQPLLRFVSNKIGVTYPELIEMDFIEIINLLKSQKKATIAFRKVLQHRGKSSALITTKGKTKILTGSGVKKFFQEEIGETDIIKKDVLKGQTACAGRAIGQVVIFKSEVDIPKVKKGNVMVAASTVPSFVPAMEKAAAIVTEMGGLLSHAAIVSRELNVPCMVGVEGVMKILKNGDQVEVDATKGIVKKIK